MISKIEYWWRYEARPVFLNIRQGLKNLTYWLPVVWKDRPYDHSFIYEILKHKLKQQAEYIGKRNRHTTALRDARRMILCTKLIQICQDDFYVMEYMDYSEDRHWFEKIIDDSDSEWKGNSLYQSECIWEKYDDYFKKYPLIYKRVLNGEGSISGKDKKAIAMNIAYINQERAHKLLFKIMEENIQTWWD